MASKKAKHEHMLAELQAKTRDATIAAAATGEAEAADKVALEDDESHQG